MSDFDPRYKSISRSRVSNMDTDRLLARREQLLDLDYMRELCDGSKREMCTRLGERVGIEGELLNRGFALDDRMADAAPLAAAILARGEKLAPMGKRH